MQNLIKTPEFFKTIDLIITPVIFSNPKSAFLYLNKAFKDDVGYTLNDMPNIETWDQLAYPDLAYRVEINKSWKLAQKAALATGDNQVFITAHVRCANDQYQWYEIHKSTIEDFEVITFLNINALHDANRVLHDALKEKDTLLSILAHDVRSPLTNIRQLANHYEHIDLSKEGVKDFLNKMNTQVEYVFSIINSLLTRTSGDLGIIMSNSEVINLVEFYKKYQLFYKDVLQKSNVTLELLLSPDDEVEFDPFILDIISRNLIDNAIKYSPGSGVVSIGFKIKESFSVISIRDHGLGISLAQSQRILNSKGNRRLLSQITDSFGLGLILAKEMLERCQGQLEIHSVQGEGTTFSICIPLHDNHASDPQ